MEQIKAHISVRWRMRWPNKDVSGVDSITKILTNRMHAFGEPVSSVISFWLIYKYLPTCPLLDFAHDRKKLSDKWMARPHDRIIYPYEILWSGVAELLKTHTRSGDETDHWGGWKRSISKYMDRGETLRLEKIFSKDLSDGGWRWDCVFAPKGYSSRQM